MATGNSQNTSAGAQQNKLALPEGVELGSYRIIRSLGQGGFGITYLAKNMENGQQEVIKENLPTFCAWRDPGTLQVSATNPDDALQEYPKLLTRFVEEARLLARRACGSRFYECAGRWVDVLFICNFAQNL